MTNDDTIFALATPPGRSSVAIVRLSGLSSATVLSQVTGGAIPPPRRISLRLLRDPTSGEILDHGLVLWFPAPASFTGEDIAELHMHGGRTVIAAMLTALAHLPGVRLAEPGEFSRRAFINGKMDLTAAEGLADLVAAETEAQRRQALRQMGGALSRLCKDWRAQLVRLLAYLEATIDFSDEELPTSIEIQVRAGITELVATIRTHLDDDGRGERLREGIYIAIVGPPNAGKSSLFNYLVRREAAIISATAGTTRDVIEIYMDLGGYPIILADTAGIRPTTEAIEIEGVRRALATAEKADLKIVVLDGETWPKISPETMALTRENAIVVLNKVDQLHIASIATQVGSLPCQPIVLASALQGVGLQMLEQRLRDEVEGRLVVAENSATIAPEKVVVVAPVLTRLRHRIALQSCVEALEHALLIPFSSTPLSLLLASTAPVSVELAVEDLRLAARALEQIDGRITTEEVLDVVFREFCIGK